jgi:UDP-glucose 4-epimerase
MERVILVTGAAGYIGRALITRLGELGLAFRAVDIVEPESGIPPTHRIEKMDIRDSGQWSEALEGADTVIHLAAESYIDVCEKSPNEAMLTNLASVYLLLKAARNHQVKKIIFPSSFAVYGPTVTEIHEQVVPNPQNLYGYMKLWAEQLLMDAGQRMGMDVIIFRQSNICGKGPVTKPTVIQAFVDCWKSHLPIRINGSGEQKRNFLDLSDCVGAYVKANETKTSGIFNLGGPSTVSVNQIAEAVNTVGFQYGGYRVPVIHQSARDYGYKAEPSDIICHFENIKRELGFTPSFTIYDTIKSLMEVS